MMKRSLFFLYLHGAREEAHLFAYFLDGILWNGFLTLSSNFPLDLIGDNCAGVQGKNNAYHNANKVQNQGIYE